MEVGFVALVIKEIVSPPRVTPGASFTITSKVFTTWVTYIFLVKAGWDNKSPTEINVVGLVNVTVFEYGDKVDIAFFVISVVVVAI